MNYIKTNFLSFLLLVFIGLYFLTNIFDGIKPAKPEVTIKRDTVWSVSTQTIPQYQPVVISSTPPTVIPPQYIPDTSYRGVLRQYQFLLDKYLSKNLVRDTIRLDSIGYVAIDDTISENRVVSRIPTYSYKIPIVTNTITIKEPYKPRNQFYVGGGGLMTPQLAIDGAELGFMFKNKKDQLFGVKGQYSPITGLGVGVVSYWKIKLK